MATLHLHSFSPFTDTRLASGLRILSSGDGVLLCGDAVYALQPGCAIREQLVELTSTCEVIALAEDLESRGIDSLPATIRSIDYAQFVEACARYDRTNTWL
ncbi:sulfurtransferase complex subunit TusB [Pseudomonas matsuisoli]|uniref:DsrH like protein n=1 Tax=Pseudomonas matsuisoli TaxID=1515666 RepID=A0A917PMJ1_9PSED|nr:sulfurtransferase complex subunit TusB [Pseudomonas matsuisoli]GGJ84510.1 DsrH like protein [Pseudomonas matsuisoli]